jgi:hypothetical protein
MQPTHVMMSAPAKRAGLLLLTFFAAALIALGASSASWAEETDAQEADVFDYLPLEVTASTDGLPDDQVRITATATNKLGAEAKDHTVSFEVPSGWTLVSGSITSAARDTANGESVSTTAVIAKAANAAGADDDGNAPAGDGTDASAKSDAGNSNSGTSPSTGDPLATILALILAAALAAGLVLAVKRRGAKAALSIVVALALVAGMTPTGGLRAFAEEASSSDQGGEGAASDTEENAYSFSKTVDVEARGEALSIDVSVTLSLVEQKTDSMVNLELKRPINEGAESATVVVESSIPFEGSSDNAGEMAFFDKSKVRLSGSLENSVVRDGAYSVKVAGADEDSESLDERTHYELYLLIDKIGEDVADADSDYGYIELVNNPFADQTKDCGIACVSYSEAAGYIAEITSLDGDEGSAHTFDNGLYWDGNNKFTVPVDLDGIMVGMPVRSDSEFYGFAHGEEFTSEGVTYRRFTPADVAGSVGLPSSDSIVVTDVAVDTAYTWVTFQVDGATGSAAYEQFAEALGQGLLFGGEITSTFKNTIVYPQAKNVSSADGASDQFAYANTSPIAFAWGVELACDDANTTITYLAQLHSSQETENGDVVGNVQLSSGTTFTAYNVTSTTDEESGATTTTETVAGNIEGSVYDAGQNLFELKVTVPNSQFDSDSQLLGFDTSDTEALFDSLYTYLSGTTLTMSNGSTNAFGVPERAKSVTLFDGAAYGRVESDSDSSESSVSMASVGGEDTSATSTRTIATQVITRYASMTEAASAVSTGSTNYVDGMYTLYRDDSKDSKTDSNVKKIMNNAVQVGFGINHAINLVRFLGGGFINWSAAIFTVAGLLGGVVYDSLYPEESQRYTVDDVMDKLDEMDQKIDSVEVTVNTINAKLSEQSAKVSWEQDAKTYTNLKSFLCSQTSTDILQGMDKVLSGWNELDDEGKETTTKCSRSTPVKNMPEEAVDALSAYLDKADSNAKNKGLNGISGSYTTLHNILTPGAAGTANVLDNYFSYVETKYNWDKETLPAKRAFLASFMVMYNNSYTLYSAKLSVDLYKAQKSGNAGAIAGVENDIKELGNYSDDMSKVLYGTVDWDKIRSDYPGKTTDGGTDVDVTKMLADNPGMTYEEIVQAKYYTKSSYIAATQDSDSSEVKNLVIDTRSSTAGQNTFSTDNYALSAAYDESCFGNLYLKTKEDSSTNNSWKPTCSFTLDELQSMTARLEALPKNMRPTITDSDGTTRPVENIVEEMQAIGFKTVNPNAQYEKKFLNIDTATMKAREQKILGSINEYYWSKNGATTKVYATINKGDTAATDEVDRYSSAAQNWNYLFTDFSFSLDYMYYQYKDSFGRRDMPYRSQYVRELSSNDGNRVISTVDIGNKISDPESYIVLEANDKKTVNNGDVTVRYGKVYNYKTNKVVSNQLLYMYDTDMIKVLFVIGPQIALVEYYAFGELNLNVSDPSIVKDHKSWYRQLWISETIGNVYVTRSINNDYRGYVKGGKNM